MIRMNQCSGDKVLMLFVLLHASCYHYALCSSSENVDERGVQGAKGPRAKRFILDDEENKNRAADVQTKSGEPTYDVDEISNVDDSSDETFEFVNNMKSMEKAASHGTTNQPVSIPLPTPRIFVETKTNAQQCCGFLRIGSFNEFERCLGDRCLAPNTCDGPEILEHCFFEGKYYPVNATVHRNELKCFIIKCTKGSTRQPPSTKIDDFGIGCCTRASRMYRDGDRAGAEKCQAGKWMTGATTAPISIATISTAPREPILTSTISEEEEPLAPSMVETSSAPSTAEVSEAQPETEISLLTKPTVPARGQQSSTEGTEAGEETTESMQYKTEPRTEVKVTAHTTKETTPREVASMPSSESSLEPGEEGTTAVIATTTPSSEATDKFVAVTSKLPSSELPEEGVELPYKNETKPVHEVTATSVQTSATSSEIELIEEGTSSEESTRIGKVTSSLSAGPSEITGSSTPASVEPNESLSSISSMSTITISPETQRTQRISVTEAEPTTAEIASSSETGMTSHISDRTEITPEESTYGLTRFGTGPAAAISQRPSTGTTEEGHTFEASTTTQHSTSSFETARSSNIIVTATTTSVKRPSNLTSISPEPAVTVSPELETVGQEITSEAGVVTGEVTPSYESAVTVHSTKQTAAVSAVSTEALVSISPEPAVTISLEIETTKEEMMSEPGIAPEEMTSSYESATPVYSTKQTTSVSVESTGAQTSTSPEPAVTISPETETTEQEVIFEAGTTTEEMTSSYEPAVAVHSTKQAATVPVENTEALASISPKPVVTISPQIETTKQHFISEGEFTAAEVASTSELTLPVQSASQSTTLSVESTEGLISIIPEPVVSIGPETGLKEVSTFEANTTTEQMITVFESLSSLHDTEQTTTSGLFSGSTELPYDVSPELSTTTGPGVRSTTEGSSTELRLTTGEAILFSELSTPSNITGTAMSLAVEVTEGLLSGSSGSTVTIGPETEPAMGVEYTGKTTVNAHGTMTPGSGIPSRSTKGQVVNETTTWKDITTSELLVTSPTSSSLMTSTTEQTTTPSPDEFTCRWDNMTVSTSGPILRDPTRCLHVECWQTVHGAFIDVTIVHEARGCCELQGKEMVPPGYVRTTRRGTRKRCVFGRWHTQYFDAAINMTSRKELPFKNKTYHFFPRLTPIDEALEICEKINGTLAVPDNREQEMELGNLGAEAFGGQTTFYINQYKILQHVMHGGGEENPDKYVVYPHASRKKMHVSVNKPESAYAVESSVENLERLSVPICEQGGKDESFPEYFNNLVSIGTLTEQGLPKEAIYRGMQHGNKFKMLAKMHEWRLPPVPRKFRDGHSNIGKELRRWEQVHQDLASAIKNKRTFKNPLPVYKANHFNVK